MKPKALIRAAYNEGQTLATVHGSRVSHNHQRGNCVKCAQVPRYKKKKKKRKRSHSEHLTGVVCRSIHDDFKRSSPEAQRLKLLRVYSNTVTPNHCAAATTENQVYRRRISKFTILKSYEKCIKR